MTKPSGIAGIADSRERSEASPETTAEVLEYAETRGISAETLALLNVRPGTVHFRDLNGSSRALFFPYPGGHWKARACPDKAFTANKGASLTFFNLEKVLQEKPETVYMVEGELDALSLVEAGIPAYQVLSVPNGASLGAGNGYVEKALEDGLNQTKRFIWCGDADDVGMSFRLQMVQRIGPARVHFINWPEGIKDANDMLRHEGAEALRSLVTEGHLPWPVQGIYRLSEIPDRPTKQTWSLGFPEWNGKMMLAPGTLSVVTGHPGHGKTHLFSQIWFNVARTYNLTMGIATFETLPKPHYQRMLRSYYWHTLDKDLTEEQKQEADAWIDEHYFFINHPDQRPTLEWFLEMAEIAVIRHGASAVQIDPWNRLESTRDNKESETEYILRCLRSLYTFSQDFNCHVQIIAHPSKMFHDRRGNAPILEDIAGSKHWDNVPDQGFVVHRPKVFDENTKQRLTEAKLYQRKARFPELGYICNVDLKLDLRRNLFIPDVGASSGQAD